MEIKNKTLIRLSKCQFNECFKQVNKVKVDGKENYV